MKRKPHPKAYTDHVRNVVRYVAYHLCLGEYGRTLHFVYDDKPSIGRRTTAADVDIDDVYLTIDINFFPPTFKRSKEKEFSSVGRIVVNELCHTFTAPLQEIARADAAPSQEHGIQDVVERQTERITGAIFDLLPKNWFLPTELHKLLKAGGFPPLE